MSFHHQKYAIAKIIDEVHASHPHLYGEIKKLEEHYKKALTKPMPHYTAAAACLLTSPGFHEAAHRLSADFRITGLGAETYIIDAVNAAPDFLKMQETMLHEKGVMRGRDRYFLGMKVIAPGTLYDRAWWSGDVTVRTVLADAVQDAIPMKNRTLGHIAFNYVCAALLPAGNERDFALNTLSFKQTRAHDAMLETALRYIGDVSQAYSLVPPRDLPVARVEASKSTDMPSAAKVAGPALAPIVLAGPVTPPERAAAKQRPVQLESAFTATKQPADTGSHVLTAAEDIRQLKSDLGFLQKNNGISKREGDLYLWLHTAGKNGERSVGDAAELMKTSQNVVRIMVAKVGQKLEALRAADGLEGQGHQPRTVSP